MLLRDHTVQDPEQTGWAEGGGLLSDYDDVRKAISEHGVASVDSAVATAGAGLDALGFVKDPFKGLLSAGIGWAIEHLAFLREPLDHLAGDPAAIKAHAATWHNISQQLTSTADSTQSSLAALTGWTGPAATGYRGVANQHVQDIRDSAGVSGELSTQVLTAGAVIGAVRSLIRDAIAEFIATVVERFLIAAATSPETFGGAMGLFVADTVVEGVSLAEKLAKKVADLATWLSGSGAEIEGMVGKLEEITSRLGTVKDALHGQLKDGAGALPEAGAGRVGNAVDRLRPPSGVDGEPSVARKLVGKGVPWDVGPFKPTVGEQVRADAAHAAREQVPDLSKAGELGLEGLKQGVEENSQQREWDQAGRWPD